MHCIYYHVFLVKVQSMQENSIKALEKDISNITKVCFKLLLFQYFLKLSLL